MFENKIKGTIGALIGAFLGMGVWCLLGSLGILAWLGGAAICVCTIMGYKLLGDGMSKIGGGITFVIIVVTVYVATRMNWAIELHKLAPQYSLLDCFKTVLPLLKVFNLQDRFYIDLGLGYVVTIIGFVWVKRRFPSF
jgi:hypothetical protein